MIIDHDEQSPSGVLNDLDVEAAADEQRRQVVPRAVNRNPSGSPPQRFQQVFPHLVIVQHDRRHPGKLEGVHFVSLIGHSGQTTCQVLRALVRQVSAARRLLEGDPPR